MKLEQQQNKTTNRAFLSFFLFSRFYTPNIVSDNKKEEEKRKASREGAEEEGQTRLCAKTISPLPLSLLSASFLLSPTRLTLAPLSLFLSPATRPLFLIHQPLCQIRNNLLRRLPPLPLRAPVIDGLPRLGRGFHGALFQSGADVRGAELAVLEVGHAGDAPVGRGGGGGGHPFGRGLQVSQGRGVERKASADGVFERRRKTRSTTRLPLLVPVRVRIVFGLLSACVDLNVSVRLEGRGGENP